jgi:ATP-dependent Clp protease ATP-binding subunit ClpA
VVEILVLPDFDPQAKQAVEDAKCALAGRARLDVRTLVAALCASDAVTAVAPALAAALGLRPPRRRRQRAGAVPAQPALAAVVKRLGQASRAPVPERQAVSAVVFLRALLEDVDCRRDLGKAGVSAARCDRALALLPPGPLPAATRQLLSSYGQLLDQPRPPWPGLVPAESVLHQLVLTLGQRKRRSAVLVAPTGTGKSLVVRELARRLACHDRAIPAELRDRVVFALAPQLLRQGNDRAGESHERVRALVAALVEHPRIVLFVDDLPLLLADGGAEHTHRLWVEIAAGRIACLGCATPAAYREHVAGSELLAGCLPAIRLAPPTRDDLRRMLALRRPGVEDYYGVSIPERLLDSLVELSERWLPAGHQPSTAIDLLESAAGACQQEGSRPVEMTEAMVVAAVERRLGGTIAHTRGLTVAKVANALSARLVGQERTLSALADAFVAKLGPFRRERGPLGVFLLAGPTGVGKTQAALELARQLGGGRNCLVRVDANVLGGSDHDLEPAKAELFGPPPGYRGYEPGKSGLLARVRDLPHALVLFDEIEKAPPGVADLLLQILGEGRTQDVDGEPIDFCRSFIVFTTNAGNERRRQPIIGPQTGSETPALTPDAVLAALRRMGFGNEFLGRIDHTFVFEPLGKTGMRDVFNLRLGDLAEQLRAQQRTLEVPDDLAEKIADAWPASFGARHVAHQFARQLTDQLNLADREGQLAGIRRVRVVLAPSGVTKSVRRVEGDTLIVAMSAHDEAA